MLPLDRENVYARAKIYCHGSSYGSCERFYKYLGRNLYQHGYCRDENRILEQLDNLAQGGTDKDFLENLIKETNISKDVLVRRAKGVLAAIMHDYDHFRVETIDSFFQTLLTNLAHELKLPRGFRVDLDDKAVVSQSVDRMLLGVGNDKMSI